MSELERVRKLDEALGKIRVNLPGQRLGVGNKVLTTDIPFGLLWSVSETIDEIGLERALILIIFADQLRKHLKEQGETTEIPDQHQAFEGTMVEITNLLDVPPASIRTEADRVLALTYQLLRSRSISHARAAEIASQVLETDVKPEAWRKRLERWVQKHGLPKIEQRRIY